MTTRIIDFAVTRQEIAADLSAPAPRGDSKMYLKARFTVDGAWDGLKILAVFQRRGVRPFCVELDETLTCDFPAEMLETRPGTGAVTICVGLVGFGEGAYQLPTGKAEVRIDPDCYVPGETPPPPTQAIYARLLEAYNSRLPAAWPVEAAGKALIIAPDGSIVPGDAPTGGAEDALTEIPLMTADAVGGAKLGDNVALDADGRLYVRTADAVTQGDPLPVSAQAVYAELQKLADTGLGFDSVVYDAATGYLHIRLEGEDVVDPCFIGGTGGSVSGAAVKLENLTGASAFTVAHGEAAVLSFRFSDYDSAGEATNSSGALVLTVDGVTVLQRSIEQGEHSIDVGPYLAEGTNKVKLRVTNEDDNYGTKTWTINAVALSLSAAFDDTAVYEGDVTFRYTPVGVGFEKIIHFAVDGEEIASAAVTASGRQQTQVIPAQSHGAHRLTVWATAEVDGVSVGSAVLDYDVIWIEAGNRTPVIACAFAGTAKQYTTAAIPYLVYDPASLTAAVTLAVDGEAVSTLNVDRTRQVWSWKPTAAGERVLTITCGEVVKTIGVTVESIGIEVEPVTTGLVFDLDPAGRTNHDTDRAAFGYRDGDGVMHPLTFSDNFDWSGGGFRTDEAGSTYLCVKCGTYVEADCSLFADDAMRTGKALKFIFRAANCRDYDAELLSCLADGIGVRLQAQKAAVRAQQTAMEVPYCEDSVIELDVNIEPDGGDRLMMLWLGGVPSKAAVYAANDSFTQDAPVPLRIGSADCDVHIYRIKAYENDLSRHEIHENWIADAPDAAEMAARYTRNAVFDANGDPDPAKLAAASPDLRVITIHADRMTTAKSDAVSCAVEHVLGSGGEKHHFTAEGVVMKAQGTSSAQYGEAALNLDLAFPGFTFADGTEAAEYAMTDDSIGVDYFNIKLNVASSENANNVVLADDYHTFQPYLNPARAADARVRDTVEGHPCVVFFHNTGSEAVQMGSISVPAGATVLYGCGDMNNSKKNHAVFGQGGNPLQCCVEILNNTNNQCLWKDDDLSGEAWDGEGSFEFRYPDAPTADHKAAFARLLSWVVSTDRGAATGDALPAAVTLGERAYTHDTVAYREAKFVHELDDYFIRDSLLYHYLFTERHAMVDNRAKNVFVSTDDGLHWDFTKDYDNDTAEGNDNEGGLTLSYGLEDTDTIGTRAVFNAADSVLWCNVRDLLYDELRALFLTLESQGAWDAERILAKFAAHQAPRPEALVIEDMWKKYIRPCTNGGTTAYLAMLHGTKADQRRQFERYQEKYIASKYRGAAATSDTITFRAYTPAEWASVAPGDSITVTPYADMYITLQSGSGIVSVRARRGEAYTLTCPIDTLNDTEIYLYTASLIADVGDLAPLYIGYLNLAGAVKLRRLKLGDGAEGYCNTNAASLSLGRGALLETLDLRGLPNLAQALDLTACGALVTVLAGGSGITGAAFAPGGRLQAAELPAVTSLSMRGLHDLQSLTLAGYDALRTLRVEDCPGFDVRTLVETAAGLTRVRILGIDWTLADTALLNRLAALGGVDESDHNLPQSVLGGAVYVPVVRQSELAAYSGAWSDLAVSYGTLVQQYLVTFADWDGRVLYAAYVDRGADAADPVAAGLIDAPVRASSVSTVYTYAGWDGELGEIIAPRTLTAVYTEAARQYTVRWFAQVGRLLESRAVDYGSEAVFGGEIPTRTDEEAQYVYYLFDGWDKSTACVTGDIDVWAVWQRGELPVAGTDIGAMTPAQIYAVAASGKAGEYFTLKDRVDIELGFRPAYTNIPYVDLADELVLDGATCVDTGLTPLAGGIAEPWTLVADVTFAEAVTDATMLCCMQENGAMGFKLKYSSGPSVLWGTATYSSGAATDREIMVIRHAAGSRDVTVYSSQAYADEPGVKVLAKTIDSVTDAPLILGATRTDTGAVGDYATGTLHSCRLWYGDLGDTDCRALVSWPRETYTFEVGGFGGYKLTANSVQATGVDFICASLLARTRQMTAAASEVTGFDETDMFGWLQSRVYPAFPVVWRQMMQQCRVPFVRYVDGSSSEVGSADARVWIPAAAELQSMTTEPWAAEGSWVSFHTSNQSRIRFRGAAMAEDGIVHTADSDPAADGTTTVQEGDLWIDTANSKRGYLRQSGAWLAADIYWLRGAAIAKAGYFGYVYTTGAVYTDGYHATGGSFGVCPRFSL